MSQCRFAGIDVSAKTLAVSYEPRPGKTQAFEVPNNPQGHRELCGKLSSSTPIQVCLEATGNYSLDVALALYQHGIPVMVLNPRAARDFAKALQNRSKTDAVDAQVLLEYANAWNSIPGSRQTAPCCSCAFSAAGSRPSPARLARRRTVWRPHPAAKDSVLPCARTSKPT